MIGACAIFEYGTAHRVFRFVVVNTPHNPCGKVYTKTELEQIADLAKEFNLMVMSDEVVGQISVCAMR
jgi:bifunctional pyridoxal-dependent enzyme with beta-cystathionase and maltose regulon repressor activities